jgi:hypothetical protein
MIIKMGSPDNFVHAFFKNEMYNEDYPLDFGVYFSKEKPISSNDDTCLEYEFDTEKDYILTSTDASIIWIWKDKKPTMIADYGYFWEKGTAIDFEAKETGFYVVCGEKY